MRAQIVECILILSFLYFLDLYELTVTCLFSLIHTHQISDIFFFLIPCPNILLNQTEEMHRLSNLFFDVASVK